MYQKTTLVGRLGRDPELRYTPSGTAVTHLSVATDHTHKDSNGQQVKETSWFKVSTFGKTAEACVQYLHKGNVVLVEGRLTPDKATGGPRVWQKQDGTWGASFELFAESVKFLPSGGAKAENAEEPATGEETTGDEEIPF